MRQPIRVFLRRCRQWIERYPPLRWMYRTIVAVVGVFVVFIGLLLVPLPGPGWLIVFLGVVILGTEFPAAHKVVRAMKRLWNRLRVGWLRWRARRSVK